MDDITTNITMAIEELEASQEGDYDLTDDDIRRIFVALYGQPDEKDEADGLASACYAYIR